MVLIKKEIISGIPTYYVDKDITDIDALEFKNTFVNPSQIKIIITEDADVYTVDEKLLLRFRKNKLTKNNTSEFYDNIIDFAITPTSNRGSASGSKTKNITENPKIMTNIFGFFDKFSPRQKMKMKTSKLKLVGARPCRFNIQFPEKYKKVIPLIEEIDKLYKKYIPGSYKKQYDKAKQTYFRVGKTSFTTITTNVNFQTTIHTDKGDDAEGFGNLAVIENGKYTGGETCFPQYGIAVDVRSSDILFMDVHQWHGNLPIKSITKDAKRLSIVCYLRHNVWKNTKGKPKSFLIKRTEEIIKLSNEHTLKKSTKKKIIKNIKKNKTKKNKTKKNKTKKNKTKKNKTLKK
jgi:hypothetical protein